MRIINLIVVHCSTTYGIVRFHRRVDKQRPYFDVAKEFWNSQLVQRAQEHRVTQHTKEQKGGNLWQ